MTKKTLEELKRIREETKKGLFLREGDFKAKIIVHMGTCGIAAGARQIMSALMDEYEKKGIRDVMITTSGCAGLCSREPMVTIEIKDQAPVKYVDLTPEKIRKIFNEHVLKGNIVKEYALAVGSERVGG
ncbi:MAG: (2Fe-2S) ferredoxin domain-containing protein [Acidobacteriota bacterium]